MIKMNTQIKYKEEFKINNVRELLERARKLYPDKVAFNISIKSQDIKITYKKFVDDIRRIALNITQKGKFNCNFIIVGQEGYLWLVCLLGVIYSGNTAIPVDSNISYSELEKISIDTNATNIFNIHSNIKCRNITLDINDINKILLSENIQLNDHNNIIKPINKDDNAIIILTSGTTGEKKLVSLSHLNICSSIKFCYELVGYIEDSSNIAILPSYHIFQLVVGYMYEFYIGGKINIINKQKLMKEVLRLKPKVLVVVPEVLYMMCNYIKYVIKKQGLTEEFEKNIKESKMYLEKGMDKRRIIFKKYIEILGGNLIMIHSGGSNLTIEYEKFFNDIGIDVFNGYGASECSGVITCNNAQYYKEGSVGNIHGTNCRKIKIENNEIMVKGDIVFNGYYNLSKENNILESGWFHTGDLGEIDNDGYLFITGRIKNLIVLPNGENVSPEELESKIIKSKYIKEAIVKTKANKLGTETLGVIINPNLEEVITSKEETYSKINKFIHEVNLSLPNYKKLNFIEIIEKDIEKNEIGKFKRN